MAKITIRQEEYIFSHGKPAKGKGGWAFSAARNPKIEDVYFAPYGTLHAAAKVAAEHFKTDEVWAQP